MEIQAAQLRQQIEQTRTAMTAKLRPVETVCMAESPCDRGADCNRSGARLARDDH